MPAAIVYTRLAVPFDANVRDHEDDRGYSTLNIDFNGDGTEEFVVGFSQSFVGIFHATSSRVFISSSPPPNIGGNVASILGGVEINGNSSNTLFRWYSGQQVLDNFPGQIGKRITELGGAYSEGSYGHTRGKNGYLGFEFQLNDGVHYAWVSFDASANVRYAHGTIRGIGGYIDGWAWETTSGLGIVTGAIPEPSVSLLAALSLSGLLLRRRRVG